MHLVSQKPSNSGWKCSIFWCWKSFGNVCCRLCKNDKQFVFNCFFSFLFYIFICVCSSTPFFLFALALVFCFIEIISNTKSMRGNWHLDSNLFFLHIYTSRFHQQHYFYAPNRSQMTFKFVQNVENAHVIFSVCRWNKSERSIEILS